MQAAQLLINLVRAILKGRKRSTKKPNHQNKHQKEVRPAVANVVLRV
jgi:hypothetical protein